ncbi:MAG: helix-turn-helix domain-containing protein [Stecheria intestinalis]|nr:helix-turn-helix domain-containing protein [Stecheria intestinalis]
MTKWKETRNHVREIDAYKLFFNELIYSSPVHLVKAAAQFFGMPVLLTDEEYQLISLYPEEKIGNDIYDALLENGVLPTPLIQEYQEEYLNASDRVYDPFYADTGAVAECPRIFSEVYSENRIYGHFAIMMFQNLLEAEDLACAVVFQKALQIVMARMADRKPFENDRLLLDLLDETSSTSVKDFAREKTEAVIHPIYALLVFPLGEGASSHAFAAMQKNRLPSRFYDAIGVIFDDALIVLFGSLHDPGGFTSQEITFFAKAAGTLSPAGRCGVSRPFSSLAAIRDHYIEAKLASDVEGEQPVYFSKHMMDALAFAIRPDIPHSIFISPVLGEIQAWDKKNHTDFLHTLKTYLFNLRDKDLTASQLDIHRNSLFYRLGRIQELFHLDLDDTETVCQLMLGFTLSEHD